MEKKAIVLYLLCIIAIHATAASSLFGSGKKWWYHSVTVDYDHDGDIGSQHIDSVKQKRSPGAEWTTSRPILSVNNIDCNDSNSLINHSAPEICNFIDDNCNGQSDEGFTYHSYFIDSNGDGYGDDANAVLMCDAQAPAGYTPTAPVTPDLSLFTTNHPVNSLIWGFSGENWFVSDNGTPSDVFSSPRLDNVTALHPQILSYSGTPQGHYTQYLPGDTVMDRPIGNGGFNPTATSNKHVFYGKPFSVSFFPEAVTLAQRTGAGLVLQTPPTLNRDGWIGALKYADRAAGVKAVLMFQEFNSSYADCPICTNGSKVRDSSNKIISTSSPILPGLFYTTDVSYGYTLAYSQAMFQINGYTDTRMYYSESRSTGVRAGCTIEQMKDSMDLSLSLFESKANALLAYNGWRGVAVTSWYSDGADPYGGQYVSANTWLQAYYECSLAMTFVNYDVTNPGKLHYALYGRLDRLGADRSMMNLKGKAFTVIAPAFAPGLVVNTVAVPAGMSATGFAGADHHGCIIVINPTSSTLRASVVSDNGYLRLVSKITVLQATSWSDTNPVLGENTEVGAYTIARIDF